MKLGNRHIRQFAIVSGIVLAGALIAPRAAHAISAALVQVTNTLSNPVITQPAHKTAAQLVQLTGAGGYSFGPAGDHQFAQFTPATSTVGSEPYVVPAGQNLVLTDFDFNFQNVSGDIGILFHNGNISVSSFNQYYQRMDFYSPQGSQHIHYESGFVFPSGETVGVEVTTGGAIAQLNVTLRGYLTAN